MCKATRVLTPPRRPLRGLLRAAAGPVAALAGRSASPPACLLLGKRLGLKNNNVRFQPNLRWNLPLLDNVFMFFRDENHNEIRNKTLNITRPSTSKRSTLAE